MKKIFVTDWILIIAFMLSTLSGIGLHIVGYWNNHELWHNWAVSHVLTSFLFFITVISHLSTHWGWYKGLIRKGIGKRSKVTVMLSIAFCLCLVTGVALLGVNGANSAMGLWHYRIGIVMAALSMGHILKRTSLLCKSLKKK